MKTADKELVSATLSGDKTAFEVLIRKYQNTVYGLIYSLVGNFSDAQDLTQEAFIRAYMDLHQLKDHSRFASWLCQVAKNICRMWNRHQKLDAVSLEQSIENQENGIMDIKDDDQNPAEMAEQQENQQRVLNAINSLQETDRAVVTLFYMDGLTYQEVSNFLDMSVPAVESRLHRARKHLKGELKDMVQKAFENNKLREDFAEKIIQSISTFNEVTGLALSRDGNSLWCATRGGVVKLNVHTSQFIGEYTTANGLPDNVIMAIAVDDKERLWCATMDGICMFDGEKWHVCPELPPEVGGFTGDSNDIAVDKNGAIWVATHGIIWKGKTKAAVC
ncbi:MAG: sigma-70 family RNA polymerase sigma factor [Candidatus Poribacteria bacterium]